MNLIFLADCGEDAGGIETQGQQAAGTVGCEMEKSGNEYTLLPSVMCLTY